MKAFLGRWGQKKSFYPNGSCSKTLTGLEVVHCESETSSIHNKIKCINPFSAKRHIRLKSHRSVTLTIPEIRVEHSIETLGFRGWHRNKSWAFLPVKNVVIILNVKNYPNNGMIVSRTFFVFVKDLDKVLNLNLRYQLCMHSRIWVEAQFPLIQVKWVVNFCVKLQLVIWRIMSWGLKQLSWFLVVSIIGCGYWGVTSWETW
jgi:hypothetical protein